MENKITIREWLQKYENGDFTPSEFATYNEIFHKACAAGWYDWFCETPSLNNRMKRQFVGLIKKITNDYILDNFYIWFKNNYPCGAPLYDDVRFEPMDETLRDQKYFVVVVGDERDEYRWNVWLMKDHTEQEYVLSSDKKKDIINWINTEAEKL